jgi:hypothetical protein
VPTVLEKNDMNVERQEDLGPNASAALSASRRAQEAGAAAVAYGGRELVSARAELAQATAQLVLMERARRREQVARERQVAKARAEISSLKREMQAATEVPAARAMRPPRRQSHLILSLTAVIVLAAIAGLCVRYADPLHTWDGLASVVSQPAAAPKQEVVPGRLALANSSETHALSRLSDAVGGVSAEAMPGVLKAANQWLDTSGEEACSVQSAEGGASLVISGKNGDKPLLAALSRCAQAVEHLQAEATR